MFYISTIKSKSLAMSNSHNYKREKSFFDYVHKPENVKRVLVIRNGFLGDIVSITSVLNRLNDTFPCVSIDAVVGPQAVSVLQNFKNVKNIFPFNYTYDFLSVLKQIAFFWNLHKNKYDVVIVQEVNTHFTIMAKLIRAKYTIGFTNSVASLYDYHIERPEIKMVLAEAATVKQWTLNTEPDRASLVITGQEKIQIRKKLKAAGVQNENNIVVIHFGSSNPNSDRQWVLARFAEVADHIIDTFGSDVIFTGIKNDATSVEIIQSHMKNVSISLAGKTNVRELMVLVQLSKLVIAPDTGTIHISTALDIPTVMLMGLSDPEDTGPYSPSGKAHVIRIDLPCSPCVNKNPKPEQWSICKTMRPVKCMDMITSAMVNYVVDRVMWNDQLVS